MKIKKQMTIKTSSAGNGAGGATIADRFKIEPMAKKDSKRSNSASIVTAFFLALTALFVLGGLVVLLQQTVAFNETSAVAEAAES